MTAPLELAGGSWVRHGAVWYWQPDTEPAPAPGRLPCGSDSAYRAHLRHGEPTDQRCRDAHNAAQQRPPRPALQPCGTRAAFVRHRRHGEEPCAPCTAASIAYRHARHLAQKSTRKDIAA